MQRILSFVNASAVCWFLLTTFGAGSGYGRNIEGKNPQLFTAVAVQNAETVYEQETDDSTIIRSRWVTVNLGLLKEDDPTEPRKNAAISRSLALNLFDDVVFDAVLDRLEPNGSGSVAWLGHLDGMAESQVTLIVKDGIMSGNITFPGAFYQVRYGGEGMHVIRQIDQSAFPPEMAPVPVDSSRESRSTDTFMADDGSLIDVLVVYTGAALAAAGGTTAMETLIDLAVSETNTGYGNSNIIQRINLVHTEEVSYDEAGFNWSTTLSRLRGTSDGYMDNVHDLRDTYGADEVVLIVNNTGYCGIGYLMTSVSSSFAGSAFAVVSRICATGYYSFAHEMGHNMAARHDWYVDATNSSPYSYNHGYVAPAKNWRTIMAYGNDCGSCTRLNYWSNPDVSYGGVPMGVAEGTSTSCNAGDPTPDCDADNRKTLNNTAYTVANFRPSSSCPDCSGTEINLTNVTFPSGVTCHCIATVSIVIGSGVTISSGAVVTFVAPTVTIQDGFHAEEGSVVNVREE